MSSRKPVSTARPQTFWSIEYGEDLLCVDRQALLLGVRDGLLPGPGVVANRSDHLQLRREVGDRRPRNAPGRCPCRCSRGRPRVAPWYSGRLREVPDDQRPGEGADQRVAVHVQRVGPQRGQAEVLGELVLGIHHDGLDRAAVQGALADDVHVLPALADVDGDGHDLLPGLLGQPADADTGVQAAGVGQDNPITHGSSFSSLFVVVVVGPSLPVRLMVKNRSAIAAPPLGSRVITRTRVVAGDGAEDRRPSRPGRWPRRSTGRRRAGCAAQPGWPTPRPRPAPRRTAGPADASKVANSPTCGVRSPPSPGTA